MNLNGNLIGLKVNNKCLSFNFVLVNGKGYKNCVDPILYWPQFEPSSHLKVLRLLLCDTLPLSAATTYDIIAWTLLVATAPSFFFVLFFVVIIFLCSSSPNCVHPIDSPVSDFLWLLNDFTFFVSRSAFNCIPT